MFEKQPIPGDLLAKYNQNLPRYTSYPTALQFHSQFSEDDYELHAKRSNNIKSPRDISLYIHIPFCDSLCYFCACNKVITQTNNPKVSKYLAALYKEIEMRAELFSKERQVTQIHFGGGTPTFLNPTQLQKLLMKVRKHFSLAAKGELEISIEVDPRSVTPGQIGELACIGFNRFSIGIQDLSPDVQEAINRRQNLEHTLAVIAAAQNVSESVNVDIITGLPKQTANSLLRTLNTIIDAGVSRIAAYSFAYLPDKVKAQKLIAAKQLPDIEQRQELNQIVHQTLLHAGYQHLGIDHYTLPNDSLYKAFLTNTLQRNFQGYTTHAQTDLIGLGVSAISSFESAFSQNAVDLSGYQQALNECHLPVVRGVELSQDDRLRGLIIQQIMCHGYVNLEDEMFDELLPPSFRSLNEVFASQMRTLDDMQQDGLLLMFDTGIRVTEMGRFFARHIASVFDYYLMESEQRFSRAL